MCNRLLLCLVLLTALALPASAQTPSGEISGTVVDSSGSVLPGVRVTLTNSGTNAIRLSQTNETGVYVFPAVPPGTYSLKVELEGFSTAQQTGINVQVGSSNRFPFTMAIGALTDVVSVVADTPVIQTENASIGTVIENRSIVELPLNGRNYLQLASLIPGATTNGPASAQGQQRMGGQRNSFSLNVAGQRIHYNHYSLDGVENTDLNFNSYMLLPSVDALEEFKVESGIFGAEFGRAVAQINASTKSGTNAFHGTVFEFVRNAKMDSKNFFDPKDKPIAPFSRNQFGATIGGPVLSNKLFFMFNWEGLREEKSLTSNASLPLTAWKAGDFSNLRDAAGNLIVIYDPATALFDTAGNVVRAPTAFPDNKIPASRIHQASQKLLRYYPTPDAERTGANFVNSEAREVNSDQYTYRIDYTQSATMNWFFRHSISHELGYDPFAIPDMGSNTDTDVQQMVLGNTQTIGTNKLNDLRIGYGQLKNAHISPSANVENVVKELGINIPSDKPLYWGVPNIGVTALSGLGEESDAPVHQRRQDDSVRQQLLVDSRESFGEIRRRDTTRPVRSDRRRRHTRPVQFRRPLHAAAAAARGAAGRCGIRGLPAGTHEQLRVAGRRPHRGLPVELLRRLYPGQLEDDAERDARLRAAVGIRPAVHRRRRQDRQYRLRLGQQPRTGLRTDGHRRSL